MPSPSATVETINRVQLAGLSLPTRAPVLPIAWAHDTVGGALRSIGRFLEDVEAFSVGADAANLADGINILDLPAGFYQPRFGRFSGSLKNSLALGENAAGEIGVGTVIGSGAVATLGGTPTFEDWMDGQAIVAITAGATVAQNHAGFGDANNESFGAALSLYLNIAAGFSDEASAHKIVVAKGSYIELHYNGCPATVYHF